MGTKQKAPPFLYPVDRCSMRPSADIKIRRKKNVSREAKPGLVAQRIWNHVTHWTDTGHNKIRFNTFQCNITDINTI
jgi:hypothetical protein